MAPFMKRFRRRSFIGTQPLFIVIILWAYYYVVGVDSIIRNNCNIAQRVFTLSVAKMYEINYFKMIIRKIKMNTRLF